MLDALPSLSLPDSPAGVGWDLLSNKPTICPGVLASKSVETWEANQDTRIITRGRNQNTREASPRAFWPHSVCLFSPQSWMVNFLLRCSVPQGGKGGLGSAQLMTRDKRVHQARPRGAPGFRMAALGHCQAWERLYVVPHLSLT